MRNKTTAYTLAVCAALLVGACAGRGGPEASLDGDSGVAPALVVERFLQAANTKDLDTMARLFGTREGSVLKRDDPADVERRVFLLASVLRHEDYDLVGENIVPGRLGQAIEILVALRQDGTVNRVPFVLVRTEDDGRWLVERIGIEAITGG